MLVVSQYTFLFVKESKNYLYNLRSNFFSEISKELYDSLINESWNDLPDFVIKELCNKEVLVEKDSQYDFYYSELMKFNARNNDTTVLSLVIAPTTKCNFDCPYCFEPKIKPKTITSEINTKIIEFIKTHKKVQTINLTWYGGEPLLAFPKIKELYEAINQEDMPKIVSHSLITNGYYINDDIICFLKKNKLTNIQITLDGTKEKHNTTRILKGSGLPTYDKIIHNIDRVICELSETKVDIRVNINKFNYMDFVEIYKSFREKYPNNKNVNVYPGIIREETEDKTTLCVSSYKPSEMLDLYNKFRELGIKIPIFPYKKIKGCMMQSINSYIIGPEGEIYKCWNDVSDENKIIGNINNSELKDASLFIKYTTQAIPFCEECKQCMVFPLCDGGCSYHRYRNMFEGCNYELCSPYKNKEKLQQALFSGDIKTNRN